MNLGTNSIPDGKIEPIEEQSIINEKELDNIFYNCTECSSFIEILLIKENENSIKFKCEKKHKKDMPIEEYLKEFEKNKKRNEKCNEHNQKYSYYCFNCIRHLCEECLKIKKHKNHKKEIIIENQPSENNLRIIREKIENYNKKIEDYKNKIYNNKNISKEEEILKRINEMNENKKINELKENKIKFINEIEKIKERYEKEIKTRKREYKKENDNILNRYKEINNKAKIIYMHKVDILKKK